MSPIRTIARRWLPFCIAACLAVAGCAAPGATDGQHDPAGQSGGAGDGGGGDVGGNGDGGASSEGPITIAFDGQSIGYEIGRCEVIDGVVYARARGGERTGFASFEATLPEWDREIAHSRRHGRINAIVPGDDGGVGWELTASFGDPGTTWDWTVSGSQVEVSAVMGDRTTASRDSGIETFVDYYDVTITMECTGTFGTGDPGERMHEEFFPLDPPIDRVPGSLTVELNGSAYEIGYLTTCQFFSNDVSAEGVADEAYAWFYSEGAGVNLDFRIGDLREEESLERWMLPPDASFQSDFPFEGSGTIRTWTGDVVSENGDEGDATITVECPEGDAFDAAGTASISVDGATYVLDEVSTCSIDGSAIEFFGRESAGDVAVVVTSGGSDILFGDASGQTVTSGVEFTVNGQQATWSGLLAGDRQATIEITCG